MVFKSNAAEAGPRVAESSAVPFEEVLAAEREEIRESRRFRYSNATPDPGPIGLAFSGGGIRSATFCLGVLQSLASADLLRRFDYLSTVSGGGYIGSWLTAWIKRSDRGVLDVEEALKRSAAGAKTEPIDFLRDYSNYLAPQAGLFTADSWTIAAVWLRNTLLNQAVIILGIAMVLLLPRIVGLALPWIARFPIPEEILPQDIAGYSPILPSLLAAILMLWVVLWRIGPNLLWFQQHDDPAARKDGQGVIVRSAAVLLIAAWLGAASFWYGRNNVPFAAGIAFTAFFAGVFWLGLRSGFYKCFLSTAGPERARFWWLALLGIALVSGSAGAVFMLGVGRIFESWTNDGPAATWHLAVWGGPVVLVTMTLVAVLQIGLLGRWLPDDRREWWARLGAWSFILSVSALCLTCISIYGPRWVAWFFNESPKLAKGVTAGWVLTTVAGVFAGKSDKSGGKMPTGKAASNPMLEILAELGPYVALIGAFLAISTLLHLSLTAGLCAGSPSGPYPPAGTVKTVDTVDLKGKISSNGTDISLTVPVSGVVSERPDDPPKVTRDHAAVCSYRSGFFPGWRYLYDQHWNLMGPMYYSGRTPIWGDGERRWIVLLGALGITALLTWFLAWRVDINEFSLHHFYKNRLVRCYLGASSPDREAKSNPFTGFSSRDDVRLATLHTGAGSVPGEGGKPYIGPYLIVNAALNISHGKRLAWQERKAASFIFTPRYSGYDGVMLKTEAGESLDPNAFRPTNEYAYPEPNQEGGIHLGTCVAISGAAASPNMGYHTSTAVAFLLTLFNVRLGWWLGNPRHTRKWRRSGPMIGLLYLVDELFGMTTAESDYVYLSDGGHFENMGIYELVRRKCRLIFLCDAEEDHNFTFGGLGNAIRKCRNDLGVNIDIDLRPLLDRDEQGRTSTHVLVGKIHYDDQPPGTLVYLKSSLVKPAEHDEPADVLEYSMRAGEFPHQSTGDQFFDESQFESYRRLGMHIGELGIQNARASSTHLA